MKQMLKLLNYNQIIYFEKTFDKNDYLIDNIIINLQKEKSKKSTEEE